GTAPSVSRGRATSGAAAIRQASDTLPNMEPPQAGNPTIASRMRQLRLRQRGHDFVSGHSSRTRVFGRLRRHSTCSAVPVMISMLLVALLSAAPQDTVRDPMRVGWEAIEQGDGDKAAAAFRQVLITRPGD